MRVLAFARADTAEVLVAVGRDDLSYRGQQDVDALCSTEVDPPVFVPIDLFASNHHEGRPTCMDFSAIRGHQIDGRERNTALLRAQRRMVRQLKAGRTVSNGHRISPRTYNALAITVPATHSKEIALFSIT